MDIPASMASLLRNGILIGICFSIISLVVFWRTLISFVSGPTVIGYGPFFTRFVLGIGIGVAVVAVVISGAAFLAVRYAH